MRCLVHSIFENTINLLTSKNEIISIIQKNRFILPRAIIIESTDFAALKKNLNLDDYIILTKTAKTKILIKTDNIEILSDINLRRQKIFFSSYDLQFISKNCLENLELFNANLLYFFDNRNLIELLKFYKAVDFFEISNYLIGRGQGLTPTGDDILTGMLYALKNDFKKYLHLKKSVLSVLHKTNIFSQNILIYAMKDYYNEFIEKLYLAAATKKFDDCIKLAKRYGHTSGFDILIGLTLAGAD